MAKFSGIERKLFVTRWKGKFNRSYGYGHSNLYNDCFKLPKKHCNELEQLMARLWWGQRSEEKRIQWVGWKQMYIPKGEGGLGFRDLHTFGMAMFTKQSWCIMR